MVRSLKLENLTYRFEPINYAEVLIMEEWVYSGFEKSIYMDRYHESRDRGDNPIKGPRGCVGFSVYNKENTLFGLFEYYFEKDGVYLGLAINPLFTGRGLSKPFIQDGLMFFKEHFKNNEKVKIEVHRKNIVAIKAYEKCGFNFTKRDGDILLYTQNR